MYFKADYDKLSEISRSALTECNNLNDAIADMIQICSMNTTYSSKKSKKWRNKRYV